MQEQLHQLRLILPSPATTPPLLSPSPSPSRPNQPPTDAAALARSSAPAAAALAVVAAAAAAAPGGGAGGRGGEEGANDVAAGGGAAAASRPQPGMPPLTPSMRQGGGPARLGFGGHRAPASDGGSSSQGGRAGGGLGLDGMDGGEGLEGGAAAAPLSLFNDGGGEGLLHENRVLRERLQDLQTTLAGWDAQRYLQEQVRFCPFPTVSVCLLCSFPPAPAAAGLCSATGKSRARER